jgi:hypothetical protein
VARPLRLAICAACGLAQLADALPSEVDPPGAAPPTASATMARHAVALVDTLIADGLVGGRSRVLDAASHGGYLQPFLARAGIGSTILEDDPLRVQRLRSDGIPVLGPGDERWKAAADLVLDSYRLAHLQRPRDALIELARAVAPEGALVVEVDHLLGTVTGRRFDAIGPGHPVYLSLDWLARSLEPEGLVVVQATEQPVYGGALRIVARHAPATPDPSVAAMLAREAEAGLRRPEPYAVIAAAIDSLRADLGAALDAAVAADRPTVGYGAPGRAVTFLNVLGIGPDRLPFVVDRSPAKHGRTVPGTGIPIRPPAALHEARGDVLVLTWNLVDEVRRSLPEVEGRGGRFLVADPDLRVVTGS